MWSIGKHAKCSQPDRTTLGHRSAAMPRARLARPITCSTTTNRVGGLQQGSVRPRTDPVAGKRGIDDVGSAHSRAARRRRAVFWPTQQLGIRGRWTPGAPKSSTHRAASAGAAGLVDRPTQTRPNTIGILFAQRMMDSPEPPKVFTDFCSLAYGALPSLTNESNSPGV
jgi:hypothetical protein